MRMRLRLAASLPLILLACADDDAGTPDAGNGHSLADLAACENTLLQRWQTTPPATGLGRADVRAQYTDRLRPFLQKYKLPGGAITITAQGKLVLALGLGLEDRHAIQAAHPDQRWRLASVSKQVTAAAIMHLVDDGQLALDDRVFDILTGYQPVPGKSQNPALASITVRHLLNHTGGWSRYVDAVGDPMFDSPYIADALGVPGPADPEMTLRFMLDQPLAYAPGTTMCYSNFGYMLLGLIIEKQSGMSYGDYVTTKVLAPAGAGEIALGGSHLEDRLDNEVRYYGFPGEGEAPSVFPGDPATVPVEYGAFSLETNWANGGWVASPVDFARFQLTIDHQAVPADQLSPASLAAMLAHPGVPSCNVDGSTTPTNADYWYGFGLAVNSFGNFLHDGSLPGTSTYVVYLGSGYTWAAFFNSRPSGDLGAFEGELDQTLAGAYLAVATWPTADLFDQYPAFSAWMSAADLDAALAAASVYPSRLEGRLSSAGTPEFRARLAPIPAASAPSFVRDLDCIDYTAAQAEADTAGRALVSLQSYVAPDTTRRYQAVWASQ